MMEEIMEKMIDKMMGKMMKMNNNVIELRNMKEKQRKSTMN